MAISKQQQIQVIWDQLDDDGQKCWGGSVDAIKEEDYQTYLEWATKYLTSPKPPLKTQSSPTPLNVAVVPEMTILLYGSDCSNAHSNVAQPACLNTDLISLYEFDEPGWSDDYGSYDLTAGGNPPTMTGYGLVGSDMPTFTDGTGYGYGLGNADVPLSSKTDFTIAFWVAGTNSPTDYTLICGGSKIDIIYDPHLMKYRFTVGHGVGTEYTQTDDAGNADFNITRFIVCRRDDTHLSISMMWSGGSSFDCIEHSLGTSYVDLQGFGICDLDFAGSGIGNDTVTGVVDEVAIWQRCLSQAEVDWLWGGGSGRILSQFLCGGGVLLGGTPIVSVSHVEPVLSGGGVLSGSAESVLQIGVFGGCIIGGGADITWTIPMQGGCKVGGGANIQCRYTLDIPSSGAVLSTGYFANGFRFYDVVTHPRFQIDENLQKFFFTYVTAIDPIDTDGVNYLVTTNEENGTVFFHDVLRYENGYLHISWKTDLTQDALDVYRVYYG